MKQYQKDVPVYAFVEDVAASGGYWLACAADEIYVDGCSMTGSIGVITAGFGLQDLIARYGVERRVHTAGKSKSMLDPSAAARSCLIIPICSRARCSLAKRGLMRVSWTALAI